MAVCKVVVDISHGLQVGVADSGAEKFEPAFFMSLLMASDNAVDAGISRMVSSD